MLTKRVVPRKGRTALFACLLAAASRLMLKDGVSWLTNVAHRRAGREQAEREVPRVAAEDVHLVAACRVPGAPTGPPARVGDRTHST